MAEEADADQWSADFVEGKGEGMIMLLHGKPGVGKTYTAGMPRLPPNSYEWKC